VTRTRPILVALAGLPGTGKSTLARVLAAELLAPVLDKDRVRAALFRPDRLEHSPAQDDLCMRAIYAAAALMARSDAAAGALLPLVPDATPLVSAILDGRTYTRTGSVAALVEAARGAGTALLVVECRCADALAEERLARDAAAGAHPARNRGVALHRELRARAEPLAPALAAALASTGEGAVAHLVLDTGAEPLARQVERVQAALARLAGGTLPA
jgi:predicted kinase